MQIRPLVSIFALVIATMPAVCQSPTEADQLTLMYGRFAYLVGMSGPAEAAIKAHSGIAVDERELARKMDAARLEVQLTNIKSGPIQEVLEQPWGSVNDMPMAPQEILHVNVDTDEFQDSNQSRISWRVAVAKWLPADPAPPQDLLDVMLKWPVKRMLDYEQDRLKNPFPWTRYATYSVTIKFQGKTATYKTICFFGKDSNGQIKALPEDAYFQTNAMAMGIPLDFYPSALLHSSLREYPPLKGWLKEHSVTGQNCHTGEKDFCCSGNSCGIVAADLDHELSQPTRREP